MLTPARLMDLTEGLVDFWAQLEQDITKSIVRRLLQNGFITDTSAWQIRKLRDMRMLEEDIAKEIVRMSKLSEKEVARLVNAACKEALAYDDAIYDEMGLTPTPIAQAEVLQELIKASIDRTNGLMQNFTNTTAETASKAFENALDRAFLQVQSGAFSYQHALSEVIKTLGSQGIKKIAYPTDHTDHMDVAARRALLTGLNQATAQLQIARMDEVGCDLVEVTSHAGARPSHAAWQGKVYSRSGKRKEYEHFNVTGYGSGDGLCGWNCYHNFFPFYEGLSSQTFEQNPSKRLGKSNDQVYEESQKQRAYERAVREKKRLCVTLEEAIKATDDTEMQTALNEEFQRAAVALKRREAKLKEYCKETNRTRLKDRESTYGFGRSVSQKAVQANKKAQQEAE